MHGSELKIKEGSQHNLHEDNLKLLLYNNSSQFHSILLRLNLNHKILSNENLQMSLRNKR